MKTAPLTHHITPDPGDEAEPGAIDLKRSRFLNQKTGTAFTVQRWLPVERVTMSEEPIFLRFSETRTVRWRGTSRVSPCSSMLERASLGLGRRSLRFASEDADPLNAQLGRAA